jgi:hypothetical protein
MILFIRGKIFCQHNLFLMLTINKGFLLLGIEIGSMKLHMPLLKLKNNITNIIFPSILFCT